MVFPRSFFYMAMSVMECRTQRIVFNFVCVGIHGRHGWLLSTLRGVWAFRMAYCCLPLSPSPIILWKSLIDEVGFAWLPRSDEIGR